MTLLGSAAPSVVVPAVRAQEEAQRHLDVPRGQVEALAAAPPHDRAPRRGPPRPACSAAGRSVSRAVVGEQRRRRGRRRRPAAGSAPRRPAPRSDLRVVRARATPVSEPAGPTAAGDTRRHGPSMPDRGSYVERLVEDHHDLRLSDGQVEHLRPPRGTMTSMPLRGRLRRWPHHRGPRPRSARSADARPRDHASIRRQRPPAAARRPAMAARGTRDRDAGGRRPRARSMPRRRRRPSRSSASAGSGSIGRAARTAATGRRRARSHRQGAHSATWRSRSARRSAASSASKCRQAAGGRDVASISVLLPRRRGSGAARGPGSPARAPLAGPVAPAAGGCAPSIRSRP